MGANKPAKALTATKVSCLIEGLILYYMILILLKLFADDTTICIAGESIENAISRLKDAVSQLLEWCSFNRLDINWSKTYIMFIGNVKDASSYVYINEELTISVVTQFKLLGVTIDNKMSFVSHVSQICQMMLNSYSLNP